MHKVKIPTIEIDINEYDKFKLLTARKGKTMSSTIRELIKEWNKEQLRGDEKERKEGLGTLMSRKYTIKGNGVTSTNYKKFLYDL